MPVEIGVDSRYMLMVGLLLIYLFFFPALARALRAGGGGGLSENRKHNFSWEEKLVAPLIART